MDKKVYEALNTQVQHELYSGYLYLSMAAYFENQGLEGFAKWMKAQAKEEVSHAMKIFDFLNDRGQKVILQAIQKPPKDFDSPIDIFNKSLAHERKVTGLINSLYQLSQKASDNATVVFLQWFVSEQVEEEKNVSSILDKLKLVKPGSGALLMVDKLLGKRG